MSKSRPTISHKRTALLVCMLVCVVAAGIGLKAQAPNPPTQFLAGQTFEGILGVVWATHTRSVRPATSSTR